MEDESIPENEKGVGEVSPEQRDKNGWAGQEIEDWQKIIDCVVNKLSKSAFPGDGYSEGKKGAGEREDYQQQAWIKVCELREDAKFCNLTDTTERKKATKAIKNALSDYLGEKYPWRWNKKSTVNKVKIALIDIGELIKEETEPSYCQQHCQVQEFYEMLSKAPGDVFKYLKHRVYPPFLTDGEMKEQFSWSRAKLEDVYREAKAWVEVQYPYWGVGHTIQPPELSK